MPAFLMKVSTAKREVTDVSEMPCRLIDDLHERRNEISSVPSQSPLNITFWCKVQRFPVGSEDPVELYCSLLLRCEFCCAAQVVVAKALSLGKVQTTMRHHPVKLTSLIRESGNNGRQTVRLGRHPAENVSVGPKVLLIRFRNPEQSARAKVGLTVSSFARDAEAKAGSSEPLCPHWWGLGLTEKLSRA